MRLPGWLGGKEGKRNLEDAVERWLRLLDARATTLETYRGNLGLIVRFLASRGREKPAQVRLEDLEDLFLIEWKGLSGSTKLRRLSTVRRFFAWALAHGYVRSDPTAGLVVPARWERDRRRGRDRGSALSLADARRLIRVCREPYTYEAWQHAAGRAVTFRRDPPESLYRAVLIALHTGLRRRNVLGLTWRHLDLEAGAVHFEPAETKADRELELPLHRELLSELRRWLHSERQSRIVPLDELVCGLGYRGIETAWPNARRRAGLPDGLRLHDLRHTFATWIAGAAPEVVVKLLLGHAPATVTDRYTQHVDMATLRGWIDQLPPLLVTSGCGGSEALDG